MNLSLLFFPVVFLFLFVSNGNCYLPVICIPGILDNTNNLKNVCNRIAELHNGTEVFFVQPLGVVGSILGLWLQVELYRPNITAIFAKYPNGVHILAHSQGTLIARGIMATTPDHPVKNFVSIAGLWLGLFGIPQSGFDILGSNVLGLIRDQVYLTAYTDVAQDTVSAAGFWNDPHHQDLYLMKSKFLAVINCQKTHPNCSYYKTNYLRSNNTIMFGSPNDEVLIPWQTSQSGFFDYNLNVVLMKDQYVFTNDSYGLGKLAEENRLFVITIPGPKHTELVSNLTYTDNYYINWMN